MFDTVLIANRGEIACRVIRTLRRLGIRSAAVHTASDAGARHVAEADLAVRVPSYLDAAAIVAAARATGAEAIHPGYGFLAENAGFAAACAEAGVVFVGPSAEAIAVMGDKIRAKAAVAARGVPVVPGVARPGLDDEALGAAIEHTGYPALIKPSAGGGGKGMHVVTGPHEVREAIARARREATGAFGDDTLFVERYLNSPRHIEVQVLADGWGTTIHLGERECSLQRRHQKVIEEAPSPLLSPDARERMGRDAVETARAVGYTGAGTVEFVVSAEDPDHWFFLEMNTRLQVEHPVTELVTGVDLVEQQLRVAAGERLGLSQGDIRPAGHAIEARLYAEDAEHGFLPSTGEVLLVEEPSGEGIRVDSALRAGLVVGSDYDPMLGKIIAWGANRAEALARLRGALRATTVLGPTTNLAFLSRLLDDDDVRAGRLDTGLIERRLGALTAPSGVPDLPVIAALVLLASERAVAGPWGELRGFRIGGRAPVLVELAEPAATVRVDGDPSDALVTVGEEPAVRTSVRVDGSRARVGVGGLERELGWVRDGDTLHLSVDGAAVRVREARSTSAATTSSADPGLRSPMPGTVVAVHAADGDEVMADAPVVVVEAMKMEHAVRAGVGGILSLRVAVGDRVERGDLLASVHTAGVEEES